MPRIAKHGWERLRNYRINAQTKCWHWMGYRLPSGYGHIVVTIGPKVYRTTLAHRYAYESTYGSIPKDALVLHRCDNPSCINPAHLYVGTQVDNMQDAMLRGRIRGVRGEANRNSKLTASQVREIKAKFGKVAKATLARDYGVSLSVIRRIALGQTWSHV